jgi:hypothetical protein
MYVMIQILNNLALFFSPNFLAKIFEKSLHTSVPAHGDMIVNSRLFYIFTN